MNEYEDTPQTRISKARTLEEITDFWDTHSLDDFGIKLTTRCLQSVPTIDNLGVGTWWI
jgi:hypothetical protein